MADYYLYLWRATWFEALGLLCLGVFVVARLIWKAFTIHKQGSGRLGKLIIVLKVVGWFGILSTYLLMLHGVEPDWFAKAQWIQGEVQGKAMTQSSRTPYTIEIQSEIGPKTLVVDGLSYQELSPGQRVKMSYLPHRLEVVTCEILP